MKACLIYIRSNKKTVNKLKQNKGMIILVIFLIWAIVNSLKMFTFPQMTDRVVLEEYDLLFLGYASMLLIMVLGFISVFGILKQKKWGAKALYSFFGVNASITVLVGVLGLMDLELIRSAFEQSRQARGLSIGRPESLAAQFSILGMLFSIFGYVVFYGFLTYWVNKNKSFFEK